jgi:aminopeptidase N
MKKSILFLVLFIVLCSFDRIKKNDIDITSYNIVMKLDTVSRKLEIQTDMLIEIPNTSKIIKLLFSDLMKIDKATINGNKLDYTHTNDTLFANVGSLNKIKLTLNYSLPIDSFKNDKMFALTRAMKWCPFVRDDVSELTFKITLPKGYKAYSSGELISNNETNNSNYYEFHNKLNSGLPLFIAPTAYYKETDKKQNNISIRYYFHNPDTELNNSIIKESLKAIDFCVHYIGGYNRTQLTYIEFPTFPMAQSLETFLMMGTDFIKMFGKYPDMKFWVAHETIHQWIGVGYFDAIYTSPKYSRFIEESLTEYMRYIYLEKNFGKDSLADQIKDVVNIYNKQIKGTDQDVPISSNSPNRVTYCVGPLILHVVRMKIGEDNWQKFISSLYSKYYGKIIDYDIFKKELSVYADSTVISNMENELEAKGIPKEIASH